MKTLDEVIKAYEICLNINETSCRDCPYTEFNAEGKWACSLCGNCTEDVLQYLKAYREDKDDLTALRAFWTEQQANPPLDYETLKTMLGQPVWLVYDWNNVHYKGWILLDHLEDIFILDAKDNWALSEVNMDKWKAYRKERG